MTSNTQIKKVFSGWFISVENARLFLTKKSSTNKEKFVSIEHNNHGGYQCSPSSCGVQSVLCPKSEPNCGPYGECFSGGSPDCP